MSTKNIKQLIKAKGDNTFERAMRMYGIKPKDAEKIFKSTDWADVDNGGNSSGEESASTIEYLDLRNVTTLIGGQIPLKALVASLAYTVKIKNPNNDLISLLGAPTIYSSFSSSVIPTLDFYEAEVNFKGIYGGNINDGIKTYHDTISQMGVTQEQLDSIPRITKEQFYDLNA